MIIKTYRLRLTIFYTAMIVLIFSVFALLIYVQYKKTLLESFDKYLLSEVKTALPYKADPKMISRNEEIIKKIGDEYYVFINNNGRVLITSLSKGGRPWELNKDFMLMTFKGSAQFDTVNHRGVNYRILYFPIKEDMILRRGFSLEEVEEKINTLRRLSLIFFPLIVLVSSVMSWLLAGKALAPIVKIKSLAEHVKQGKLQNRIETEPSGKEIDDLVTIFNEMLESVQRSFDVQKRFTSDVSHEIRSPLTSLRGSIEVALRKKRSPEEYEEILRTNLSDIFRLSKITDNLLLLAKADNNILELGKQWFDINLLLKNIVERMRYNAISAGVTLSEEYYEGLELYVDIDLLDQAFSNLIDNAIKYTRQGGKVTIKTNRESDTITVSVSDTGTGIPEDEIPHIFNRFYRANKERPRKLGGTGLGLAIAQLIINAHNGNITVKSSLGSGTDFIVTFPKP